MVDAERVASDEVVVRFSYDEALVLSDLLARSDRVTDKRLLPIDDPADGQVLDDLCASFEPVIDEVLNSDYDDLVEAARRRIAR